MAEATTTAVAKRKTQVDGGIVRSLPIQGMADLLVMADFIAKSGQYGARNQAEALTIVTTVYQTGMTYLDFMRTFHLIDGKPAMKADAMAAAFRKRGGKYDIVEYSPKRCALKMHWEGASVDFETTMQEAVNAGWPTGKDGKVKTNWRNTPADMLWARTISKGVRKLAPEVNSGVYTPEEIMDFESEARVEKVVNAQDVTLPTKVEEPQPQTQSTNNPFIAARSVDVSICPCGTVKGQKFDDLDNATLEKALNIQGHGVTEAHKDYIKNVIAKRAAATVDVQVTVEQDETAQEAGDEPETQTDVEQ